MLPTINLNDHLGVEADEIYEVPPDGHLSTEPIAVQLLHAQRAPQYPFRVGTLGAQLT